jgi:hypothetical protein
MIAIKIPFCAYDFSHNSFVSLLYMYFAYNFIAFNKLYSVLCFCMDRKLQTGIIEELTKLSMGIISVDKFSNWMCL